MKTIGIFGKGGVGKSSLVKALIEKYKKDVFYLSSNKSQWKEYNKQEWIIIEEANSEHYCLIKDLILKRNEPSKNGDDLVPSVEEQMLKTCEWMIIVGNEIPSVGIDFLLLLNEENRNEGLNKLDEMINK